MFKTGKLLFAAAIVFGTFSTVSAYANTIFVIPVPQNGNDNSVTVTFGGTVLGLWAGPLGLGPLAASLTNATGFEVCPGCNDAASAAGLLNTIIGGNPGPGFTASGSNFTPANTASFNVTSDYFALKAAGWIAFFRDITPGNIPLSVLYSTDGPGAGQNGAGLSHVTYFNAPGGPTPFDVPAVPLPASVWLFGTGLAGLSMLRRFRKRTAVAA